MNTKLKAHLPSRNSPPTPLPAPIPPCLPPAPQLVNPHQRRDRHGSHDQTDHDLKAKPKPAHDPELGLPAQTLPVRARVPVAPVGWVVEVDAAQGTEEGVAAGYGVDAGEEGEDAVDAEDEDVEKGGKGLGALGEVDQVEDG